MLTALEESQNSALLNSPIQMLISSCNTLADTPINVLSVVLASLSSVKLTQKINHHRVLQLIEIFQIEFSFPAYLSYTPYQYSEASNYLLWYLDFSLCSESVLLFFFLL